MHPKATNSSERRPQFGGTLSLMIVLVFAGVYILSLGPMLRYSGKPLTLTVTGSTVKPPPGATVRGRSISRWVPELYHPLFVVVGWELTPSHGRYDPININRHY
jgi:hypothetical protein